MRKLILLLTVVTIAIPSTWAKVFHVAPTLSAAQSCPSPCYTLDQYAQNTSLLEGHNNITLSFLRGHHELNHTLTVFDPDVQILTLQGQVQSSNEPPVVVSIQTPAQIYLKSLSYILIADITMQSNFSTVSIGSAMDVMLLRVSLHLTELQVYQALTTYITGSNFLSLWFVDSPEITILETTITGNNYNVGILLVSSQPMNVTLKLQDSQIRRQIAGLFSLVDRAILQIKNCQFRHGFSGLVLFSLESLLIQNSTFSDYGYFAILMYGTNNATIKGSSVTNNRYAVLSEDSALTMEDTVISSNVFGMILTDTEVVENAFRNLFKNCSFSDNSLFGLTLIKLRGNTTIENSTFCGNKGTPLFAYQSGFELIGRTVFRDNMADSGGGLALYNSTVNFALGSRTYFINNTVLQYGGAIYIVSLPSVPPAIQLAIDLENLRAQQGILARASELFEQTCFFTGNDDVRVIFSGNSATLGGYSIFGPTIYTDFCSLTQDLFVFDNATSSALQVSSDPSRVCFCVDNKTQCEDENQVVKQVRYFPGEKFSVSVVLAGYKFGRAAGSVYVHTVDLDYRTVMDESQHVQTVNLEDSCANLNFAVFSSEKYILLSLTAQEVFTSTIEDFHRNIQNIHTTKDCEYCTALLVSPIYINVTLETCPLGFKLTDNVMCDCDETLTLLREEYSLSLTCEMGNQTSLITRDGTVWLGVDTRLNNSDSYFTHRFCHRDYCKEETVSIDLRHPDEQCNVNRSGMLCGGCKQNYSLQLGGSSCAQCNNNSIAFLLLFAFLGILLVAFITLLDLTVANGTVNGLIFYANVVWLNNNGILFAFGETQSFSTIPIAWINLDFGIVTCFNEGLDQLTKTGLQFVFPVYIWCLAGLIIVICHYSTRATKLFGNNSVAVLATLFLLSYGKLFRNIADVFVYATIVDSSSNTHIRWALDGNISYGGSEHAVLMVIALVFFLVFLLPYTLVLLLVPFFRGKSDKSPLKWVDKLQPFFDAYYGPFKLKRTHLIWIGLLLLVRVVILLINAYTTSINPNINILFITTVATLLLGYSALVGLLYKQWYVSFLETLYLLNLVALGASDLFFRANSLKGDRRPISPVVATYVGLALVQLGGIIVFHIVKRIKMLVDGRKKDKEEEIEIRSREPTVHVIDANNIYDSSRYQESLLGIYDTEARARV